MKIRTAFVSNSSATSFIFTNLTGEQKTLVDFVLETPHLIAKFIEEYGNCISDKRKVRYTQEQLILEAEEHNITFEPNESKELVFGDEDGDVIGHVYDYILRGEDLSHQALLMEKMEDLTAEDLTPEIRNAIFKTMEENTNLFTGVRSESFRVVFNKWER